MGNINLAEIGLLDRIKEGRPDAFEELFNRYWEPLYLFALKRVQSEDDAKDIVQELFIKFWLKKDQIVITKNLESYLFSIVKYEVLHKVSQLLRSEEKKQYYQDNILPQFTEFLDPVQEKELLAAIDKQVQSLPERLKEVYLLRKEEGLSIREIAGKLNISEQTVKNQLGLAVKRMRGALKETLIVILLSSMNP